MRTGTETSSRKPIVIAILIVNIIVFCLFLIPNTANCADLDMVRILEPDEGEPISVLYHMLGGGETIIKAFQRFLYYDYYHYGFPYFGYSALLLLFVKWSGHYSDTVVLLPVLRQMVSVLPMLLAITGLTYLWTEFKKWLPTFLIYFGLLTIPAVIGNMLWWHPDGLQFLFIVLVMLLLKFDHWNYKYLFLLTGFFCGFSVGIKLQGLFFFLTIPTYLLIGILTKKIKWKHAIFKAVLFLGLMAIGLLVSNPMLIHPGIRATYWDTLQKQAQNSQLGYGILYPRGFNTLLELISDYYGWIWLYLFAFAGCLLGIFSDKKRLPNLILLSWFLPQFIYLITSVALKYQYLMGAFVPLLAGYMNWLEFDQIIPSLKKQSDQKMHKRFYQIIQLLVITTLVLFISINISDDIKLVSRNITRGNDSEAIQFFQTLPETVFEDFSETEKIYIDYRVYFPQQENWDIFWSYDMLDYQYVVENTPNTMVLIVQRMLDYTDPENVENAINPAQMERSLEFYQDALNGEIEGYELIYEQSFAKIFKKVDIKP